MDTSSTQAPALRRSSQRALPRGAAGWVVGRLMFHRASSRARARWVLELLQVEPHEDVLEIGCGPGYAASLLLRELRQGSLVAIDHSPLMIAMAERRFRRLRRTRRLTMLCADVIDLPRFDVSFDKVYCIDTFEHFADPKAVLAHVRTRMTPRGRIALAMAAPPPNRTGDPPRELAERIARALGDAGFDAIERRFDDVRGRIASVCVLARAPAMRA